MIDKSPYRRKLPKLIGSFALVASAVLVMINNFIMSGPEFSLDLIIFILKISVPSALCLAYIAYLMGRILDKKSNRRRKKKILMRITSGQDSDSEDISDVVDSYQIQSIFSAAPGEIPEQQPEELNGVN